MSELHDINRRVAVLKQIASDVRQALGDIRTSIEGLRAEMERRFEAIDRRFEAIDRRFVAMEGRQWTNIYWLLGVMLGGFAGMLAVMAHGFHWL